MEKRLRLAVIFGGRSAEHEVSLVSASSIIKALDRKKYELILIGITHEGSWITETKATEMLNTGKTNTEVIALPVADPTFFDIIMIKRPDENGYTEFFKQEKIDVIFPVLHGTYGEDGTIQGLFELMDVPYVGAGVLGSAVGMDKIVQKKLLKSAGIPIVDFLSYTINSNPVTKQGGIEEIESKLDYPIFVKPANLGSSVGISKAGNRNELIIAIKEAYSFDRKIILEQGIKNAREIEISVLGNDLPRASVPGEVKPSGDFYDYQAKYEDNSSVLEIPANIPDDIKKRMQKYAVDSFKAIDCAGMARVDFLLSDNNELFLSELNTIPGFTAISMYPKLWQASGLEFSDLLDELINLALERHKEKKRITDFSEKISAWYKKS